MALSLSVSGDLTYVHSGAMVNVSQATMAAWVYRSATGTESYFGLQGLSSGQYRFGVLHYSDDSLFAIAENGGGSAYGYLTSTITGWHHIALVFDGTQGTPADRVTLYVDAIAQTFSGGTLGTFPTTIGGAASKVSFGSYFDVGNNLQFGGHFAEAAMWSTNLPVEDIRQLAAAYRPLLIHQTSLKDYWSLLHPIDLGGGNVTMGSFSYSSGGQLDHGTFTVLDHPRIVYAPRRRTSYSAFAAPPSVPGQMGGRVYRVITRPAAFRPGLAR